MSNQSTDPLTFDLLLDKHEKGYRARVIHGPVGEEKHEFVLPFSVQELRTFLELPNDLYRHLRISPQLTGAGKPLDPESFGTRLFKAVFAEGIYTSLMWSIDEARRQNSFLRVRLHLNEVPELAILPWEYLFNPKNNQSFALSADSSGGQSFQLETLIESQFDKQQGNFDAMKAEVSKTEIQINTNGGTSVGRNVNTGGGDFIGRDQIVVESGAYVFINQGQPVQIQQLTPPKPTRPPTIVGFVGRDQELSYFADKLTNKHLAVITGMAGVGKTAVAAVMTTWVVNNPDQVFWHSFHKGESIDTVIWQLAGFLAWHGHDSLWRILQSTRLSGTKPPPVETLFDYLLPLVRGGNYVLCFDDFHFVDEDPALNYLAERLRNAITEGNLSLIVTSRRMPEFARIIEFDALTGLRQSDTRRLLIARGVTLTEPQINELYNRTSGNAEFLTLAIDALQQAKDPEDLIKRLATTGDVESYLMKEVDDTLTGQERKLMTAVALLLGYPGTREAIEAILNIGSLWRSLRHLHERHLLTTRDSALGTEYGQHAIVQAFYYEQISRQQRPKLHHCAGDYYAKEEPDLLRSGIHYEHAGEYALAVQQVTADIWLLINQGHAQMVRRLLESSVDKDLEQELQAKVNITLGWLTINDTHIQESQEYYYKALSILNSLANSPTVQQLKVEICWRMGELLRDQSLPEALHWCQQGLQELGEHDTSEQAGIVYCLIGNLQIETGEYDFALNALKHGLSLLPEVISRWRLYGTIDIGRVYEHWGDIETFNSYMLEALEMSKQLQDTPSMLAVLNNLATIKDQRGDWTGAITDYKEALQLADKWANSSYQMVLTINLGRLYMLIGEDEEAHKYLKQGLDLTRSSHSILFEIMALCNLADLYLRQRQLQLTELMLNDAKQKVQEIEADAQLPELYRLWAQLRLEQNQSAQKEINQSLKLAKKKKMSLEEGKSLRIQGQVLLTAGDRHRALKAFKRSLKLLATEPYESALTKMYWGFALMANEESDQGNIFLQEAQLTFHGLGAKRDLAKLELK